jgi:hypothetical protein
VAGRYLVGRGLDVALERQGRQDQRASHLKDAGEKVKDAFRPRDSRAPTPAIGSCPFKTVPLCCMTGRRCTQHRSKIRAGPHLCDFVTFAVARTQADLAGACCAA